MYGFHGTEMTLWVMCFQWTWSWAFGLCFEARRQPPIQKKSIKVGRWNVEFTTHKPDKKHDEQDHTVIHGAVQHWWLWLFWNEINLAASSARYLCIWADFFVFFWLFFILFYFCSHSRLKLSTKDCQWYKPHQNTSKRLHRHVIRNTKAETAFARSY